MAPELSLAELLRRYRKAAALSQKELGEILGYSDTVVSRVENGKYTPSQEYIEQFLEAAQLGLTATEQQTIRDTYQQVSSKGTIPLSPQSDKPTAYTQAVPQRITNNLPPLYGDFLGRAADLKRVLAGLTSRWPVISIEGLGGVGKTTLAIEAACRSLSPTTMAPPFAFAVWVSAKDYPERKLWLEETLDTIARVLDHPYITQLPLSQKQYEVDNLLRTHRVLVLIDNYETMEDPDLEIWIQQVPEPSKVMLTTRQVTLRRVWDIHLQGLPDEDALQLIRQHSQRLELQGLEQASETTLLPLVHVTAGNPQALEMALGYVKYGGLDLESLVAALQTAYRGIDSIFDELFEWAWETLSEHARRVLMAMTFFADTAHKNALGAIAELGTCELAQALRQLTEMSLLEQPAGLLARYIIHPLTRAFATAQVQGHPDWETAARHRWLAWFKDLLVEHEPEYVEYWPLIDAIDNEESNLLLLLGWVWENCEENAIELTYRIWPFIYIHGHWPLGEKYVKRIDECAIASADDFFRLWLISQLAWILIMQGRYIESEAWLQRIIKEVDVLHCPELLIKTLALNNLAVIYMETGNFDAAEEQFDQLFAIMQGVSYEHEITTVYHNLARMRFWESRYEESVLLLHKILAKTECRGWKGQEAHTILWLIRALLALGRFDEAEQWLNHKTVLAYMSKEAVYNAHICNVSALLAANRGQISTALTWAYTAQGHYHRLGMHQYKDEMISFITRLEMRLAQSDGDH